jgi:hypothetical protein
MAKVKQAIQDVEEEVMEIVMSRSSLERGHETISLPEVQTILFKKYFHKDNSGYFLDENVVKKAYKGDLRIDSWLIKIFLTNGEEKTIVDLPEEISQSIDEYLTEIEEDLI